MSDCYGMLVYTANFEFLVLVGARFLFAVDANFLRLISRLAKSRLRLLSKKDI